MKGREKYRKKEKKGYKVRKNMEQRNERRIKIEGRR